MKFISYCALLSTAVGTTTQEDLDTMPEAHVTNTPQTWKADTYTNNARQDTSEDKPTECPVKCNYDGTPGRHMTVIWDGNSLGQANRDGGSGWKCGLEVSTGSQCECACEGDEMSVTVTRSCFEEWSRSDQQHILNHQDGGGYHFLPNGQGFAGDNPLCSHDDAAGDGLQIKHTINADLSGTSGAAGGGGGGGVSGGGGAGSWDTATMGNYYVANQFSVCPPGTSDITHNDITPMISGSFAARQISWLLVDQFLERLNDPDVQAPPTSDYSALNSYRYYRDFPGCAISLVGDDIDAWCGEGKANGWGEMRRKDFYRICEINDVSTFNPDDNEWNPTKPGMANAVPNQFIGCSNPVGTTRTDFVSDCAAHCAGIPDANAWSFNGQMQNLNDPDYKFACRCCPAVQYGPNPNDRFASGTL